METQQPPKPNEHRALWPLVIEEVFQGGSSFAAEYVAPDMLGRHQKGLEAYGTPLQPFNGRDPLLDAYEEALDMTVYLKQLCIESPGKGYQTLYNQALHMAIALRSEMYLRNGC